MGLLNGAKAIVTGGGSGIGRATARRMTEEGARVAVLDVDGDAAEAVAKEIDGFAFGVDVGNPDEMRDVVDAAVAELGGLSLLYNNAGTSGFGRLEDIEPAEWERVLRVNLTGVYAGFRAAIPHLKANGHGAVVNTASISGTRPAHQGQCGLAGDDPHHHDQATPRCVSSAARPLRSRHPGWTHW